MDIYKIVKTKEIKDESSKVSVNDEEIKERQKYFYQLFNENQDNQVNLSESSRSQEYRNINFYQKIQFSDIEEDLKRMKYEKPSDPMIFQ